MTELAGNVLCYGDNLDILILRRYLPDAAIDPPRQSRQFRLPLV